MAEAVRSVEESGGWDLQLRLQARLLAHSDLLILRRLRPWQRARRVVDVGCGNGTFLAYLADLFPDKEFVGVDIDADILAFARQKNRRPNVRYQHADIAEIDASEFGSCDFMIARFVTQHLPSLEPFVRSASELLSAGGMLYVHDVHDRLSCLVPDTGVAEALHAALETVEKRRSVGRTVMTGLVELGEAHRFELKEFVTLAHRTRNDEDKSVLRAIYQHVLTLFPDIYGDERLYRSVVDRLDEWYEAPGSWGQAGTRVCILRRRGKPRGE